MTHLVAPFRQKQDVPGAFDPSVQDAPLHPPEVARIDGATHYEVGVAYEQMGLPDDAIYEFELAADDPAFRLSSWRSVGRLHHLQLRWEQAQQAYEQALASPGDAEGKLHELREALSLVRSRTPLPGAVQEKDPAASSPEALVDEDDVEQAFDDLFG